MLLTAGLLRTAADKVLMFGGMAQEDMFLLPDMFELTISQRWWRQARPRAQSLAVKGLLQGCAGSHFGGAARRSSTVFCTAHAL